MRREDLDGLVDSLDKVVEGGGAGDVLARAGISRTDIDNVVENVCSSDARVKRFLGWTPDVSLRALVDKGVNPDDVKRARKLKQHIEHVVENILKDKIVREQNETQPKVEDVIENNIPRVERFKEEALAEERENMERIRKQRKDLLKARLHSD